MDEPDEIAPDDPTPYRVQRKRSVQGVTGVVTVPICCCCCCCTSGRCGAKHTHVSGSCSCQYASRAAPSSSARSRSISPIQSAR
eukprot:scaffold42794_cov63-Phaeocystis_antarctica.AAC.2